MGNGRDRRDSNRHGRRDEGERFSFGDGGVEAVLSGDGEKIVTWAEKLARALSKLPRAQIRNFYGPLISLRASQRDEADKISRLHLMRARLHYMASRDKKANPLRDAYDDLVKSVKDGVQLEALFDFSEALVAYHRGFSS